MAPRKSPGDANDTPGGLRRYMVQLQSREFHMRLVVGFCGLIAFCASPALAQNAPAANGFEVRVSLERQPIPADRRRRGHARQTDGCTKNRLRACRPGMQTFAGYDRARMPSGIAQCQFERAEPKLSRRPLDRFLEHKQHGGISYCGETINERPPQGRPLRLLFRAR